MRRWLTLMVGLVGCVQPALVDCPGSELTCPVGYVCDEVHHTCVTPDQLASCQGIPDGATCTAGAASGYCLDQVCFPVICGNGIVEFSEACDDGNQASNDGCNATCSSTEQCGNGHLDVIGDERCDDGNLIDADGCDSGCQPEQAQWTVTGVSLRGDSRGRMVYETARHRMLYYADSTWSSDGTAWSLLTADGPPALLTFARLVYLPSRERVVLVGQTSQTIVDETWEWNGTSWTRFAATAPPTNLRDARVTYDPVRQVVLVVGSTPTRIAAWALDPQLTTWTPLPDASAVSASFAASTSLAFDEARGVAVFVQGNTTYEWNGAAWTTIAATPPVPIVGEVMFDAREAAVVAHGGTTMMAWDGTAWTALAGQALPVARNNAAAAWDPDRQRRILFGGSATGTAQPDSYEWDGASWIHVDAVDAPYVGNILVPARPPAYDPQRRALIQLGGPSAPTMEAWALVDATWSRLPDGPFPGGVAMAFGYDPVRGGMVVNTRGGGTWLLAGDTWSEIEAEGSGATFGFDSVAYDPSRGALVGVNATMAWELPSTATQWRAIAPTPQVDWRQSLVFDARLGRLMLHGGAVYDLLGDRWQPSLSPGYPYRAVAAPSRGSVMFVGNGPGAGPLWERSDDSWREYEPPAFTSWDARPFATSDGGLRVLVPTIDSRARLLYERRYVGPGIRDACTGGDDDGDGLTDCADRDCWFACTPACPPYASCAP